MKQAQMIWTCVLVSLLAAEQAQPAPGLKALHEGTSTLWRINLWASALLSRDSSPMVVGSGPLYSLQPLKQPPEKFLIPEEVARLKKIGRLVHGSSLRQIYRGGDNQPPGLLVILQHDQSGHYSAYAYQSPDQAQRYQRGRPFADRMYFIPNSAGHWLMFLGFDPGLERSGRMQWGVAERIYPEGHWSSITSLPPSDLTHWRKLSIGENDWWQQDEFLSFLLTPDSSLLDVQPRPRFLTIRKLAQEELEALARREKSAKGLAQHIVSGFSLQPGRSKPGEPLVWILITKSEPQQAVLVTWDEQTAQYVVADALPFGPRVFLLPLTGEQCAMILGLPLRSAKTSYAWTVYHRMITRK
ncbi:MAG: hypothetical protein RMI91_15125 [Gemmatales bacterium]|nr:hypothetical protein [Gemmatales bacterium]